MAGDNAQQIGDWNGPVGERWAAEQEMMDPLIRPFGEAAMRAARLQPGESVLDIGCGCGDTSLPLAEAVGPAGKVVGVDVSAPMLAVARRRAAGIPNLSFIEADASRADLSGPFDLLFSRFGVMFFDDPPAAFARIRGAMKPGGRLAFACWRPAGENPWAGIPGKAAFAVSGLPATQPNPFAPGPFALSDTTRTRTILETAGFVDVAFEPFEAPYRIGDTPRIAAETASRIGPASRIAREAGPDRLPAILDAMETAFTPYAGPDGAVILPGRVWIITGRTA